VVTPHGVTVRLIASDAVQGRRCCPGMMVGCLKRYVAREIFNLIRPSRHLQSTASAA
jgi:hypothetical protein